MANNNLKVGIVMPTRNRADFVIRQIRYYASVNSPHSVYIGDSSNQAEAEKIKNEIDKLRNKINIRYEFLSTLGIAPALTITTACKHLLSMVKEEYVCLTGDDDYQIPNSLTICAEFLANHPDYATVSGQAVSFRLKGNGAYGDLNSLSDYPVPAILEEKATERLIHFMSDNFFPLFLVNRTDQLVKSHEHVLEVKDHILNAEIVPSALSIIDGKSTTLDCLSFVKQIHDKHFVVPKPFDWLTSPEWNESYKIFEKVTSENIAKKDNIPLENAVKATKQAFETYVQRQLAKELRGYDQYPDSKKTHPYKNIMTTMRLKIAKTFPFLKYIYRMQIKPRLTGKKELHYEIFQSQSPYYKDFKPVKDSFTGLIGK